MKGMKFLFLIACLAMGWNLRAQKVYEVQEPLGKVKIKVEVGNENISYCVLHEGEMMITPSVISMTLTDGRIFGVRPRVVKVRRRNIEEIIRPPLYHRG